MGQVTKVMRYQLIYQDGGGDFYTVQQELWELQRQTREILNKTIQTMYLADANKEKFDNAAERTLNRRFCVDHPDMYTKTVTATLRKAKAKYNASQKEILAGRMSLPSYKRDQPILLNPQGFKIEEESDSFFAAIAVFSDKYKNKHPDVDVKRLRFRLVVKDGTQRAIIRRVISGEYKLGRSQLLYSKKKWFLNVTYSFEPAEKKVDPDKILGVDLGCVYAIYASSFGSPGVFKISGDEVSSFERKQAAIQNRSPKSTLERVEKIEERHKQKQQQARYCGEGRIGHGTKTRIAPVYQDEDKIARFRDTVNHRYSKALIDYAEKNGYGTIQMEDLSGIKSATGFPKRLKHWTYYDLQTKIEYKAEERGIKVVKIDPRYTSQRCSRCGYIDSGNRKSQAEFCCMACGFSCNADYNASQNISIGGIAKIIADKRKEADAK
jgi:IS605 OrfB family transposase